MSNEEEATRQDAPGVVLLLRDTETAETAIEIEIIIITHTAAAFNFNIMGPTS